MGDVNKELLLRTKAFALRVTRMYCRLSKADTVAQVLGKQVLRSELRLARIIVKHIALGRNRSSGQSLVTALEIEEALYWLELLLESGCVALPKMMPLLNETRACRDFRDDQKTFW